MRTSLIALSACLVLSCKGKPTANDPPPKVGSAAEKPSSPPSSADVKLPERTTTPPLKTTKPLAMDELKKLGLITFPGFTAGNKILRETIMVVIQTMVGHPALAAGVTIKACDANFACIPMDLAKWQATGDKLKELLPMELRTQPDTHFESGMTDVNGEPMVFTYQYGMNFTTDETGTHGKWSHAYVLYYNDGSNQIRIVSEFKDLPPKTVTEMIKQVPREELENLAKAMMDFYTHKWATS